MSRVNKKSIKVGIIGANGFSGKELIKILSKNKKINFVFLHSRSAKEKNFENLEISEMIARNPDIVFFCTPHGIALNQAKYFLEKNIKVIDLSADFRFKDPQIFEEIYHIKYEEPLFTPIYGLTEIFKDKIKNAKLIANPGCYVTSALLAGLPIKKKFNQAIFDAKSGYSGAGVKNEEKLKQDTKDNFIPYKICDHRHYAEIQQFFDTKIFFTPHVLATFRGISTTCHFLLKKEFLDFDFFEFFKNFYKKELSYIKIQKEIPTIRDVQNTDLCILGGFEKDKNGRLVIISVLDNLRKGAASQAMQNFYTMMPEAL